MTSFPSQGSEAFLSLGMFIAASVGQVIGHIGQNWGKSLEALDFN